MSTTSPRRHEVLVLDFDGVLCDALDECTLVAHLVHAGLAPADFADPGLAGIPAAVIEHVRRCRPFMRHLGHFIVPLVTTVPPPDRAAFAAQFARIPRAQVEAFIDAATTFRAAVRRDHEAQWLEHHHVKGRVAARANGAYIATARDAESVWQILRSHGARPNAARIFPSLRDKTGALEVIASLESVTAADVRFVDDSIENCLAATAAGYTAEWASWGHHAPGDAEIAHEHGIRSLTIDDLLDSDHEPLRAT